MSSSCGSQLPGSGLFNGEELLTVSRIITTCISITVVSAWFSGDKIKRLRLFFAHWLAGLVAGLGSLVQGAMVTLCWTGSNLVGLMKTLKFIELAAANMFAVTNLAICVNLALVVSSQRTMSRVKSVSSTPLLLALLGISIALAAPVIPLAKMVMVTAAGYFVFNENQRDNDLIIISFFYVEFFIGICMLTVVAWLLLFRLREIKECWKIHARIRFYFMLTLVGIAVNLVLGINGVVNVRADDFNFLLLSWSWSLRYTHFALDTIVLYGVLRERNIDERGDDNITGSGSGGVSNLPSGRHVPCEPCDGSGIANGSRQSRRPRGSRQPRNTSRHVSCTPPV